MRLYSRSIRASKIWWVRIKISAGKNSLALLNLIKKWKNKILIGSFWINYRACLKTYKKWRRLKASPVSKNNYNTILWSMRGSHLRIDGNVSGRLTLIPVASCLCLFTLIFWFQLRLKVSESGIFKTAKWLQNYPLHRRSDTRWLIHRDAYSSQPARKR